MANIIGILKEFGFYFKVSGKLLKDISHSSICDLQRSNKN